VQLAKARGAVVVGIDIDPAKLGRATQLGAAATFDGRKDVKELRSAVKALATARGAPLEGWRIFEMSGTPAGQELAWALLTPGGAISIVGFTPKPATVKLSNLMAFDATVYGNWGCGPELYPGALAEVLSGAVKVESLVRRERLDDAPRVLEAVHHGEYLERVVLVP